METINKISKTLGISGRTISTYGVVNGVNVRVSDHMPKIHNLIDYINTLHVDNGVCNILLVLIDKEDSSIDEMSEEMSEQYTEYFSDFRNDIDVVNVSIITFDETESEEVIMSNIRKEIK